jgi:hypothetical protein
VGVGISLTGTNHWCWDDHAVVVLRAYSFRHNRHHDARVQFLIISNMVEGNVLVISNRLPVTIKRTEDGKYDYTMSSGGLVAALSGLKKSTSFKWFGWPGKFLTPF